MKLIITYLLITILAIDCWMVAPYPREHGYIQMKDAKIYFESGGGLTGAEHVILLHAGFLDANMWKEQVQELSKFYRVIAIDIPGHGRTENDTVRLLPADFIKVVMDSLKIPKASLIGVSFGAACATDFMIAHPGMVNKAVLVASGINGWERKFTMDSLITGYVSALFGALEKKDTAAAAEIFTRTWFDGPYRTPQQVTDSTRRYIYETTLGNMKKHKVRGWPVFAEPPAMENISKIKTPVLIIRGDKDMPHIDSTTAYLEKNISGARLITIPGTGHMLNMEAPARFNKAVMDFLGKR